jgi:hypothetical protein
LVGSNKGLTTPTRPAAPSLLRIKRAIELREIVDETFLIPSKTAPTSRLVIEDYLKRSGLDIIPDHEVDNITHAVSMIASTGAVALLPAYPNNLLPWSVTSRPLKGRAADRRLGHRISQGEHIPNSENIPLQN